MSTDPDCISCALSYSLVLGNTVTAVPSVDGRDLLIGFHPDVSER